MSRVLNCAAAPSPKFHNHDITGVVEVDCLFRMLLLKARFH